MKTMGTLDATHPAAQTASKMKMTTDIPAAITTPTPSRRASAR